MGLVNLDSSERSVVTSDGVRVYKGDCVRILNYHKLSSNQQTPENDPGWNNMMDAHIGVEEKIRYITQSGYAKIGEWLYAPEWIVSVEHDDTEIALNALKNINDICGIL